MSEPMCRPHVETTAMEVVPVTFPLMSLSLSRFPSILAF